MIISFIHFLYRRIFRSDISLPGKAFLHHFHTSAFGGIVAGIILFLSAILAGRFLGPEEYGKYALVLSYGNFLIIPMLFGFDTATIRSLANTSTKEGKGNILSTSLRVVSISTLVISIAFSPLIFILPKYFHIERELLVFALLYAIPLVFKNLFDGFARGLEGFREQFKARLTEAFFLFTALLLFLFVFQGHKFYGYSLAMSIGLISFVFVLLPFVVRQTRQYDRVVFRSLLSYAGFAIFGGIAGYLFLNGGRITLAHLLGETTLGIFSAYYTASTTLLSQLFVLFNNVFFPTMSKISDKREVIKKINTLSMISFLPLLAFSFFATIIIFSLYGEKYPLDIGLAFLFSLSAVTNVFYMLQMWLTNTEGVHGVRFTVLLVSLGGILNISLIFLLGSRFGLHGVVGAGFFAVSFLFVAFRFVNRRLFESPLNNLKGGND